MAAPVVAVPNKASGDPITLTNWTTHLEGNINFGIVQGANLASATTLPDFTNWFHKVTGAVTIRNLASANALAGQPACIWCTAAVTFEHNGGGTGNIRTPTSTNVTIAANEIVEFVFDGTVWWMRGRSNPLPIFTGAYVYHAADQTISSSEGALAFNSEDKDSNAYHDTVTNNSRLTVPAGQDGTYEIEGYVPVTAIVSGAAGVASAIKKNGTMYLALANHQNATGQDWTSNSVHPPVVQPRWAGDLVATDYVELMVTSKGGSNATVGGRTGTDPSRGAMFRIRKIG